MATMSARERSLIGLAAIVAIVIGGWLFLIEPVLERRRTTEDLIPAREAVLAKRRDLISRAPSLRQSLADSAQQVDQLRTRLLMAATPPVAAAELARIVKETAGAAGLEVRSERMLPPATRGELLEIPLEITFSGGIRELVTLLEGLDAVPKLLTLQDLKIRVLNVSQPKELLTTLTVSGYILPKAPAA
jgi:Tfp pilus assembly protein PilO